MCSGHGLEIWRGGIGPWQEIVDLAVGMVVDDPGDDVGEVGLGLDAAELAGLDERGDDGPVFTTGVGAGEESIFSVERDRADRALDDIRVDLDATVIDEACQPLPAR